MVIKNETLPCHNSETPASAPPSSTPDQLEEENDVSREDLNVDHDHDKLAADDIIDEEEFDQHCDLLDQETPEDSLSQDTLIQDVVSVSIIEQSSLTEAESSKIQVVAENNNSISSPLVYYYTTAAPAPPDVFILVNTLVHLLYLKLIVSFFLSFPDILKIPCFVKKVLKFDRQKFFGHCFLSVLTNVLSTLDILLQPPAAVLHHRSFVRN